MTKYLLLFCCAGAAFAQSAFPPELGKYLGLPTDQTAAIQTLGSSFTASLNTAQARINVLNQELAAETARAVVDTGALGVRYVEIETLQRGTKAQFAQFRTASLAVLNDAQTARMKALVSAAAWFPLLNDAYNNGLVADPASLRISTPAGTVLFYDCCGGTLENSGLAEYLALTPA